MSRTHEDKIKESLINAYEEMTPDRLNEIKAARVVKYESMEDVLGDGASGRDRKKSWMYGFAATAVAAVLFMVVGINIRTKFYGDGSVSYIYIDVNPCVEIEMASNGEVLSCSAYNDDGIEIVMDERVEKSIEKHEKLDSVMKNVMRSIQNRGYFSGQYDSVLVSTVAGSSDSAKYIVEAVAEVESYVYEENVCKRMVHNQITDYDTAKANADRHGISPGKASYIYSVVDDERKVQEFAETNIDYIIDFEDSNKGAGHENESVMNVAQAQTESPSHEVIENDAETQSAAGIYGDEDIVTDIVTETVVNGPDEDYKSDGETDGNMANGQDVGENTNADDVTSPWNVMADGTEEGTTQLADGGIIVEGETAQDDDNGKSDVVNDSQIGENETLNDKPGTSSSNDKGAGKNTSDKSKGKNKDKSDKGAVIRENATDVTTTQETSSANIIYIPVTGTAEVLEKGEVIIRFDKSVKWSKNAIVRVTGVNGSIMGSEFMGISRRSCKVAIKGTEKNQEYKIYIEGIKVRGSTSFTNYSINVVMK